MNKRSKTNEELLEEISSFKKKILELEQSESAHKQAEEELREKNDLFSLYIRHSPVYTYIKEVTPAESRVLQASDNYEQMIGIPGPKMIGKTMAELFPAELAANINADDWSVVSSGRVLQKDEDLNGRNYTSIKFPIVRGDRTLLAGYTIDITERNQAVKELAAQHDFLSKLNHFALELSKLSSADNLEEFIAKRIKDIAGATVSIFSEYNSEKRTTSIQHIEMEPGMLGKVVILLGKQVKKIHSVISDETYQSITAESVGMRKTLHEMSFGAISKPVGAAIQAMLNVDRFIGLAYLLDGKLYGTSVLAMSKDQPDPPKNILESFVSLAAVSFRRKQAEATLKSNEERYRTIIETIPDAYFEMDLAGHNVFFNDQYARITGYTREELQGFNFSKHMDSHNKALAYKIFNEVYLTGKAVMDIQLEWFDRNEKRRILESSISLIRDLQGKPVGFRGIARDITEKRQKEVLAFHSQKLESVGQLAAGIAHEINTPIQFVGDNISFMKGAFQDILSLSTMLNAVKSYDLSNPAVASEVLTMIHKKEGEIDLDFLQEEIPQAIEQSLEGLQRVSKIVMAMREFSHPGGENKTTMDINKAIESTVILTHNEWKYWADLTTGLAPDLPIVQGFPADFNQVILNIIVNASQALQEKAVKGDSKKGRIEISTRQDGNEVEICIRDTGKGIPPEIQSRIFDPFFTTKEVGKGTGQGLAIAQNIIVHKHGGKIYFETTSGEGTAFHIRLPLENASG